MPLSPEAAVALTFIAEQQKVPPEQLMVTSEEARSFPTLDRNYVLVTLLRNQAGALQTFRVLVDPTTKTVEPDLDGIMVAEQAAYQAKYGKFDPPLYEKLQTSSDVDQLPVVIWAAEAGEEDSIKASEAEVAQLYPEAAKALTERGVPWSVDDETLRLEIKQKYAELLASRSAKRIQPIIEWLEAKGYKVEKLEGSPLVAATVTKQDILALTELSLVSQINLGGGQAEPTSDMSVPTSRVPVVWNRGITGTDVRVAIVEGGKINNTVRNCLNVIATRDNTVPDDTHKSRVAAVAACNDQTLRGVAYGARTLDAGYVLGADMATSAQGLNWAVAQNLADVTNQSERFGSTTNIQYLDRYYDYLVRAYDFTAVVSAGNTTGASGAINVATPAKGWNVIAVGDVDDKNNAAWSDDDVSSTSSYANPATGAEKPEAAAPGTNINTVAGQASGTSFAAPHVAGLAALLMQRNTSLKDFPSAVKAIIMASAVHNTEGSQRLSDRDGAGAVDAAFADWIAQTQGGAGTCNAPCWWYIVTNDSNLPEPGNLYRYFNANRGERIRVAISWLSAASADGVQDSLNTELNLHIQRPNGTVIQSSTSSVNGFEIVDFTADATGQYS